ncbi:PREDICTED: dehydrogenase/reductase SDR family member 12-like isoform X2 [Amphimedon queenslandica]|nr:PREDICTED: dehydrogenase/reductase SDR family member 12-like isoform X2 [Amphimedon queenslandica]|eukprot:XP_003383658.1 PREDICTED: dehydrogenase/reductase SDR family member 12-like isoform X2 [Amphimedon queenslandica]
MSLKALFAGGTVYRNIVWYTKGMKEFTRGGYETAARNFNDEDLDVDISNLSYMITGSNSGLGKCTALELAKRGATVHMVCRNETRGLKAKDEVINESGNEKVHLHLLDLSKPRDIVKFARDFVSSEKQLDVLVNNAGCMIHEYKLDENELETNFATNTLGTYILTTELLPSLSRSSSAQVVTVSSGGMYTEKLDPYDLNLAARQDKFDGTFAYGQNKRQQVVMSRLWAVKYPNIHFSSMHPGWAATVAVQTSMPDFSAKMGDKLRTPEQGADTITWLCIAARNLKLPSGLFFQDRTAVSEHLPLARSHSSDVEEATLMERLEQLKSKFLPSEDQPTEQLKLKSAF